MEKRMTDIISLTNQKNFIQAKNHGFYIKENSSWSDQRRLVIFFYTVDSMVISLMHRQLVRSYFNNEMKVSQHLTRKSVRVTFQRT